jgi:hypothetical protein
MRTAADNGEKFKGGNGKFSPEVDGAISNASKNNNVNEQDMRAVAMMESGGNPNAVSSTGAAGLYQFTGGTAGTYGVNNRFDPNANADAGAKLWKDNQDSLSKRGIEPTAENTYLAHQQGAGGASEIIRASEGKGALSDDMKKRMAVNVGGAQRPGESDQEYAQRFRAANAKHFNDAKSRANGGAPAKSNAAESKSSAGGEPAKSNPPAKTNAAQDPAPSATTPAQQTVLKGGEKGFNDPNKVYPKPDWLKEPDTHRLARNQSIDKTFVKDKKSERITKIPTAISNDKWDQPEIPYNAKYPYNHVQHTESGHTLEFDDTKGSERINLHHKIGTFLEIDKNGTQVNRVKGHKVVICEKDERVHIMGSGHITTNGAFTIKANQTVSVECAGDIQLKSAMEVNIDAPVIHLNGIVTSSVVMIAPNFVKSNDACLPADMKSYDTTNLPITTSENSEDFTLENSQEIASARNTNVDPPLPEVKDTTPAKA